MKHCAAVKSVFAFALLLCGCGNSAESTVAPAADTYDVHFSARFTSTDAAATATITVSQSDHLLKSLDFNAPAERFAVVDHSGHVSADENRIRWTPPASGGQLTYTYRIDHLRGTAYDARHTPDWVLLRLGDLFPPAKVRTRKGAVSHSTVTLQGPDNWSFESQYGTLGLKARPVPTRGRNFTRPTGWLVGGEIGTRRDHVNGRHIVVSAPVNSGVRRQDTLAFLRWVMPELSRVFPSLPEHILIAGASGGMWRGGLSAPGSLYLHAGRPLISENGTSTLLHELIHLAGLHSASAGADWIVEGLPEYYSLLILKRSGGISEQRFARALKRLQRWVEEQGGTLNDPSKGVDTAAAVLTFHALAQELRRAGSHIDELTNRLLAGSDISVDLLVYEAQNLLGAPSKVLASALHPDEVQPDTVTVH